MTKRDYELIAEAISRAKHKVEGLYLYQNGSELIGPIIGEVIYELCQDLQADNGQFDRARFAKACNK